MFGFILLPVRSKIFFALHMQKECIVRRLFADICIHTLPMKNLNRLKLNVVMVFYFDSYLCI